ncbi:hypothetical protein TEA_009458 [Camellia sinensis var. sinensis]|uniref:Zinc finger ZPR1-type domain-containing protein n=1 Tax=Camellia sinensis var. sinensis TaxID=542762 RepID=A0A4S4EHK7_CAMSN|nr:hypothetical protein TEA_009458 [Camellia sinensis var. sinensis]
METNNNSIMDVRSVVDVISSDDNDAPLYQGTTRFLLTLIPHFRKFAGELQPRGCHYQLNFPPGDQKIPELDFEIPPEAQRGSLSTVEGILLRAADEIEALQEERKKVDPQSAEAINRFLPKLRACAKGESSFTIILDDPAGNSFIENPREPHGLIGATAGQQAIAQGNSAEFAESLFRYSAPEDVQISFQKFIPTSCFLIPPPVFCGANVERKFVAK